jgi:hypothetical protein
LLGQGDDASERPADVAAIIAERRAIWERQRALTPPLVVGKLPGFLRSMITSTVTAMRATPRTPAPMSALEGMPASPGRATGVARILREPDEAHRLEPGAILVARATTPAWTPLFARAAAVVTDRRQRGGARLADRPRIRHPRRGRHRRRHPPPARRPAHHRRRRRRHRGAGG